jgi:hypothetical protein
MSEPATPSLTVAGRLAQTGTVALTADQQADRPRRGELRIYFGAAPGVGK